MAIFKPSQIARSLKDIDGEALKRAGIKGIILDWQNTLVKRNTVTSDPELEWMKELKDRYGMKFLILSNSKAPEQEHELTNGIPALFRAGKPLKSTFAEAIRLLGTRRNETAVIGNGILTDIWGGNRLGLYTVFVSPVWTQPRFWGAVQRLMVRILRI